jgi:hypothetical protein
MQVFKTLVICSIIIFFAGCDKNEEIFFKGNIVGFVSLVDESGNEIEDKSGVNVSMEGLANTITNNIGRYEFSDVPAGTYKIIYDKTGYGTYKRFNYQFIGGNVPAVVPETSLFVLPDIEILSLDISFEDNRIYVSGTIPVTNQLAFQIFINDNPDVSNLKHNHYTSLAMYCCIARTNFSQVINLSDTPYSPGDTIYLAVYFRNYYDIGWYFDYEYEKTIYSSYRKGSDVITLVLE